MILRPCGQVVTLPLLHTCSFIATSFPLVTSPSRMTSELQLSGRRVQIIGVIGAAKVRPILLPQKCHLTVRANLIPRLGARVLSHGDWAKSFRYRCANWTLSFISLELVAPFQKMTPDVASRLWSTRMTSGLLMASTLLRSV